MATLVFIDALCGIIYCRNRFLNKILYFLISDRQSESIIIVQCIFDKCKSVSYCLKHQTDTSYHIIIIYTPKAPSLLSVPIYMLTCYQLIIAFPCLLFASNIVFCHSNVAKWENLGGPILKSFLIILCII